MIKAWLFLHILGFALWIGGAVASMVAGVSAKREGREGLGIVARAQAAIQKVLIGPGALITVLSGLMLTFRITGQNGDLVGFNPGLVLMSSRDGGATWLVKASFARTNRNTTGDGQLDGTTLSVVFGNADGAIVFAQLSFDAATQAWTVSPRPR